MKTTICCVSLALLVAGGAAADERQEDPASKLHAYWRLQGGWSLGDQTDLPKAAGGLETSLDDGELVSGAIGVQIDPHFRVDVAEVSWRRYEFDLAAVDGRVDAYTFLTNLYYSPLPHWPVSPFAGIGVGAIYARSKLITGEGNSDVLDFAWNVRAGAEARLYGRLGLVAEYRLLIDHGAITDEAIGHEFLAGAVLRFY